MRQICLLMVAALSVMRAEAQSPVYVNTTTREANVECVPFASGVTFAGREMTIEADQPRTYGMDTVKTVSLRDRGVAFSGILPASLAERYAFELPWTDDLQAIETAAETPPADASDAAYGDFVANSDFAETVSIVYNDGSASVSGVPDGVEITADGAFVTVRSTRKDVAYELSGSSKNGQFKLYSDGKACIRLAGLALENSTAGAAINIQSKKRVFVVLADNTDNSIADCAEYDTVEGEDEKGCLFSEGQLCLSGGGVLRVEGRHKRGIVSDQYIHIIDCRLQVVTTATKGATIHGKDGITMGGGYVEVRAGGAAAKAISSDSTIVVSGGELYAFTSGDVVYDEQDGDYSSASAIKSGHDMLLTGGIIGAMSTGTGGKGINCGKNLTVGQAAGTAGTPTIMVKTLGRRIPDVKESNNFTGPSSSPKGIKATGDIIINSGHITVNAVGGDGGEGIESKGKTTINGGMLVAFCVDDILNACDGLTVNDGTITGASLTNDGIDVAWIYLNGGYFYLIGGSGDNTGCDTEGKTFINRGGTLFAVGGSDNGSPSNKSDNCSVAARIDGNYRYVALRESGGSVVLAMEIPSQYATNKKGYNYGVLFCSPLIEQGKSYELCASSLLDGGTEQNGQIVGAELPPEGTDVLYQFTQEDKHTKLR